MVVDSEPLQPQSGSAGSAPGASAPAPFADGSAAVSRVAAPAAAEGPADAAASDVPSASARAARRARAWYSGPCFRGSAYSRGLIVQYVRDDGPYQEPPSHSGSSGASAASS